MHYINPHTADSASTHNKRGQREAANHSPTLLPDVPVLTKRNHGTGGSAPGQESNST